MNIQKIVLGGGCFWCTEAIYRELRGVRHVLPGYSGGTTPNPTYEQVCTGKSGHAEVIEVEFDVDELSLKDLFTVFFGTHDPTTLNRQGADTGPQYRSVIFYSTPEQKEAAEQAISLAQTELEDAIVTQVEPLIKFYPAEDYHQNYYAQNTDQMYCQWVIDPKLAKLRQKFSALLKHQP